MAVRGSGIGAARTVPLIPSRDITVLSPVARARRRARHGGGHEAGGGRGLSGRRGAVGADGADDWRRSGHVDVPGGRQHHPVEGHHRGVGGHHVRGHLLLPRAGLQHPLLPPQRRRPWQHLPRRPPGQVVLRLRRPHHPPLAPEPARRCGFKPNLYTYNCLVGEWCRTGEFERARHLFDEMPAKGVLRNVVSYNTCIAELCRHGKLKEAVQLVEPSDPMPGHFQWMRCQSLLVRVIGNSKIHFLTHVCI